MISLLHNVKIMESIFKLGYFVQNTQQLLVDLCCLPNEAFVACPASQEGVHEHLERDNGCMLMMLRELAEVAYESPCVTVLCKAGEIERFLVVERAA